MTKPGAHWRSEEDALLLKLYKAGKSGSEAALEIGRSPRAVEARLRHYEQQGLITRRSVPVWGTAARSAASKAVAVKRETTTVLGPRGYSAETAAWALANIRDDQEAGLIALHLAERGHAAAKAAIYGRAAA